MSSNLKTAEESSKKQLVRSKIRDNLFSSNDSSIITKKFWSHVKSKSKSERIPEIIKFSNKISSDDITKANLFNDFFHEQFSEDSKYDIDIDHRQDEEIDIDFSYTRIKQLLTNINTNKAPGPDDIHGKVLKHCAKSICRPLSLIFNIAYKSGKLPIEWKQARIKQLLTNINTNKAPGPDDIHGKVLKHCAKSIM